MKETKLKVVINKPIEKVFEFITNPKNTPIWIPGIVDEQADQLPPIIGSTYENTEESGKKNKYKVTEYLYPYIFQLDAIDFDYKLKYTCSKVSDEVTEFEYHEWSESGNLHTNQMEEILHNLKKVLENNL